MSKPKAPNQPSKDAPKVVAEPAKTPEKAKAKAKKIQTRDQKRARRKFLTFVRMCRYGINNFTRNAWLTIAATAVMTVTLFVIFASFVAQNILSDTLNDIRDKVDMSIYVKPDTTDETADKIKVNIEKLSTVTSVRYISSEEARQISIEDNKTDPDFLEAIKEATNKTPGTFNIKIKDINDTAQLEDFISTNGQVKDALDPNHDPSFAGQRKEVIAKIAEAASFAQKVGIIASAIFIIMSMLIIFNTISMAIFNRRDEINMMKLIGAEKSFIRGPFIVEAIVYGFFAAILAVVLGFVVLYSIGPTLTQQGIVVQPTIDLVTFYAAFVLMLMIVAGALIGIVASLMATRRHLHL